jgi:hypothetical protein
MIQRHRRISGLIDIPEGKPLPLTVRLLAKDPVAFNKVGLELKQYPETIIPSEEVSGQPPAIFQLAIRYLGNVRYLNHPRLRIEIKVGSGEFDD